jgi:hypothetical protein
MRGCLWESNLYRLCGFTSEVSPAYGIFHYFLKKGKKQQVRFFTELLVKVITGWIFRSHFPGFSCSRNSLNQRPSAYADVLTEVTPVYGTFSI